MISLLIKYTGMSAAILALAIAQPSYATPSNINNYYMGGNDHDRGDIFGKKSWGNSKSWEKSKFDAFKRDVGLIGDSWNPYRSTRQTNDRWTTDIKGTWGMIGGTYNKVGRINFLEGSHTLALHWGMKCDYKPEQDEYSAVPEPAILGMLAIGLLGIGISQRKRKHMS